MKLTEAKANQISDAIIREMIARDLDKKRLGELSGLTARTVTEVLKTQKSGRQERGRAQGEYTYSFDRALPLIFPHLGATVETSVDDFIAKASKLPEPDPQVVARIINPNMRQGRPGEVQIDRKAFAGFLNKDWVWNEQHGGITRALEKLADCFELPSKYKVPNIAALRNDMVKAALSGKDTVPMEILRDMAKFANFPATHCTTATLTRTR